MNQTSDFVKVFDVLDSGFKDWEFSVSGLVFVAVGLFIFFWPRIVHSTGIPSLDFKSKWHKFFRYYFLGFSLLWTSTAFYSTYSQHLRHQQIAKEGVCRTVEGPVENFVPMPYSGHSYESFSVSSVRFAYSDYIVTDGFNNTASHGGPIKKDSYVRICYDPAGNHILRLEIRGFSGATKDYSKAESLFPKVEDFQKIKGAKPFAGLPWYNNLFIIFYVLDFIALLIMFVPYLETFFRLKTVPVTSGRIREGLERGAKVKLKNTMLFWDEAHRAIWLRPRGFNLFQVQLMTAKLVTDDLGKDILNQEIRFSSGFPFIMILFFWTAYRLFSSELPVESHDISAGKIIGIAAVVFVVLGYVNGKILISRMERLVREALIEIGEG